MLLTVWNGTRKTRGDSWPEASEQASKIVAQTIAQRTGEREPKGANEREMRRLKNNGIEESGSFRNRQVAGSSRALGSILFKFTELAPADCCKTVQLLTFANN